MHFCHITWSPDDPNSYRVYDKDGKFAGISPRASLGVKLDVGTHHFALKVTDDGGLSSTIRMDRRLILDPNDEWITYKVTPNKNRPPLIYTEDMLIKERKKAVHDLWVKIKQFNALSFFSISI